MDRAAAVIAPTGVLDFTSALYLGLRHASVSSRPWAQLTTGVPAALGEPPAALAAAARLASLTGREDGFLARSTLHAFWDVVPALARDRTAIHVDAGAYPIARWAVERAACRGVPVRTFAHHDAGDLRAGATRDAAAGLRPLVLADGLCAGCGGRAPAAAYAEVAARFGGRLLLDDTQALGIAGPAGGGTLRAAGLDGGAVLVVSLAKAFGAPLAFVGGAAADVERLRSASATRVHASPPSLADVHAALSALDRNEAEGDRLRARLAGLVDRFRRGLRRAGLTAGPPGLPVQTLRPVAGVDAAELHRRLRRHGVRTVLHRPCDRGGLRVGFVFTAAHEPWQVDRALAALDRLARPEAAGGGRSPWPDRRWHTPRTGPIASWTS